VVQDHGFFRAQGGVVQAAEKRGQFRSNPLYLVEDVPDLLRAGDGAGVDGRAGGGVLPGDAVKRVGGEQAAFHSPGQDGMEDGVLAADRGGSGAIAVQAQRERVERGPQYERVAQRGEGQGRAAEPAECPRGGRVGRDRPGRVEGVLVQGGAQPPRRRPAGLARAAVMVARASARLARERGARCGHFIAA
jgi:hypothetical protein